MADEEQKQQHRADREKDESIATPRSNFDDHGRDFTGEGYSGGDEGMMGGRSDTVNPGGETPTAEGLGGGVDRGTTTGRTEGDNAVGGPGAVGGRTTGGEPPTDAEGNTVIDEDSGLVGDPATDDVGSADMGPADVEGETDIGGTAGTSRGNFDPEPAEPKEQ